MVASADLLSLSSKWDKPSVTLDEGNGVSADTFFAPYEAEFFSSGGFDGYVIRIDAHDAGECRLHLWDARVYLGSLSAYSGIDVGYGVSLGGYEVYCAAKEYLGVYVFKLVAFCGGEVIADVAHVGCAEQCVADGVDEDICV